MNRAIMACLSFVIFAFSTLSLGAVLSQYTTFFGPNIYWATLNPSKVYKTSFSGPANMPGSQIGALLSIKNGTGEDIIIPSCGRLQISCLIKNLVLHVEVLFFRASAVVVSINGKQILAPGELAPTRGSIAKVFEANKNNTIEIKVIGSPLAKIELEAKYKSINLPPLADFTYSPINSIAPEVLNFSGLLSKDQDGGYITEYKWSFGDGTSATGSMVSHLYSNPGVYPVSLEVVDNAGAKSIKTKNVTVKLNSLPVGIFTVTTATALGDLLVALDSRSSYDSDGSIVEYKISWGDGTPDIISATPGIFNHTYSSPNTYRVKLTLKDNKQGVAVFDQLVLVEDKTPPQVTVDTPVSLSTIRGQDISISGHANEQLSDAFAQFSDDPEIFPLAISADGKSFTGMAVVKSAGNKNVVITVSDRAKNIIAQSISFKSILNLPPISNFSTVAVASVGDTVTFDATSSKDSDGTIVSYIWNFQDGSEVQTTSNSLAQHVFKANGKYNVSLTSIDNEGGSNTIVKDIYINSKPIPSITYSSTGNDLEIQFDASTSTDVDSTSLIYGWQFGDGATASGVNAKHKYFQAGSYVVIVTVSDEYSSSSTSVKVDVSNSGGEADSPEGKYSLGQLVLLNDIDKKFNAVGGNVEFQIQNAAFSEHSGVNTRLVVNGTIIDSAGEISADRLVLNEILAEGLNEIAIQTIDNDGLLLTKNVKIWAGNRVLNLHAFDKMNNPLSEGITFKTYLAENDLISFSGAVATNLPKLPLLVTAEDGQGRIGIVEVSSDAINSNIILQDKIALSSINNNDFSEASLGWTINGLTSEIVEHLESGQEKSNDIKISGSDFIHIGRSFQSKPDTKSVSIRFQVAGLNEDDAYAVHFKGLSSEKTSVEFRNLKSFELSKIDGRMRTNWVESNFVLGIEGEPVEVNVFLISQNQAVTGNSKIEKFVSNKLRILTMLESKAFAAFVPGVELVVDGITESDYCINSLYLVDYAPQPKPPTAATIRDKDSSALQFLSVGAIPNNYLEGKNKIAARVKSCSGNQIKRWQLEAIVSGVKQVLSIKDQVVVPNGIYQDVVFEIDKIEDKKVLEVVETLATGSKVDLRVRAFKESELSVPGANGIVSKATTFGILVRYDKYRRWKDTIRDDDSGGDDWSTPWAREIIKDMQNSFSDLDLNDITYMNGGAPVDHQTHSDGTAADLHSTYVHPSSEHKQEPVDSQQAAIRLIEIMKKFAPKVRYGVFTYRRQEDSDTTFDSSMATWNGIRHICMEDKRLLRGVFHSDYYKLIDDEEGYAHIEPNPDGALHGDHFHFQYTDVPFKGEDLGTLDIKISVGKNRKITFDPPIFQWVSKAKDAFQYEAYVEVKNENDNNFEFRPITPTFNFDLVGYRPKIKILKVKRTYQSQKKSGIPVYKYSCTQKVARLFNGNEAPLAIKTPEFFHIDLKPNGLCNNSKMTPLQGEPYEENDTVESRIGFVSSDGQVSLDSNLGMGTYVCPGSKIIDKSKVIGGPQGSIELIDSTISNGSILFGNVMVDHANVGGAEIEGLTSESLWSPDDEYTMISYADIVDSYGQSSDPYIFIAKKVNLSGDEQNRVSIKRVRKQFPNKGAGAEGVMHDGPLIMGFDTKINISKGSSIEDSVLGGSYYGENAIINILNKTSITLGEISGKTTISNGSFVFDSVVGASTNINVSNSKILSSSVIQDATISDSEITDGSQVYGKNDITDHSVVRETNVAGGVSLKGTTAIKSHLEGPHSFVGENLYDMTCDYGIEEANVYTCVSNQDTPGPIP